MSDPLAVLQRIRDAPTRSERGSRESDDLERCELCREPIPADHGHMVDLEVRNLMCACRGCYLLFTPEGAGGGHYRAVPGRWVRLAPELIGRDILDSLQIPVGIAFVFYNSKLSRAVAVYPSPAGPTESELPLPDWGDLVGSDNGMPTIEADVEALLARTDHRAGKSRFYIAPIDACYELVGRLRTLWRGFDGGPDAQKAIDEFFERAESRGR